MVHLFNADSRIKNIPEVMGKMAALTRNSLHFTGYIYSHQLVPPAPVRAEAINIFAMRNFLTAEDDSWFCEHTQQSWYAHKLKD